MILDQFLDAIGADPAATPDRIRPVVRAWFARPESKTTPRYLVDDLRLAGYLGVQKHLPGQHDQSTHGNRAGSRGGVPGTGDTIPPEPGTSPIPEGTYRLYHYTQGDSYEEADRNIEAIAREGIRQERAIGETYGEPSMVWASSEMPHLRDKLFVEFWAKAEQFDIGRPQPDRYPGDKPGEWEKRGSNVTMLGSVPANQIVAVHKPWHQTYRYIEDSPILQEDMQDSTAFDYITPNMPEFKAIEQWKRDHGVSKADLTASDVHVDVPLKEFSVDLRPGPNKTWCVTVGGKRRCFRTRAEAKRVARMTKHLGGQHDQQSHGNWSTGQDPAAASVSVSQYSVAERGAVSAADLLEDDSDVELYALLRDPEGNDSEIEKHLAGQHDQSSHGRWAHGATHHVSARSSFYGALADEVNKLTRGPLYSMRERAEKFLVTARPDSEHGHAGDVAVTLGAWSASPQSADVIRDASEATLMGMKSTGGKDWDNDPVWQTYGGSVAVSVAGATALLHAVHGSTPLSSALYRGVHPIMRIEDAEKLFPKGRSFDLPLSSFTLSEGVGSKFAQHFAATGERVSTAQRKKETPVLFEVEPGSRGVRNLFTHYPNEHEVISVGRYEVVHAARQRFGTRTGLYVTLRQTATFEPEAVAKAEETMGYHLTPPDIDELFAPVDEHVEAEAKAQMRKHLPGQHDQSLHGRWATGRSVGVLGAPAPPARSRPYGGTGGDLATVLEQAHFEAGGDEGALKVDLTGMHPDVARDIAPVVRRLFADYPQVARTLTDISVRPLFEDFFAVAHSLTVGVDKPGVSEVRQENFIHLNRRWVGNAAKFREAVEMSAKTGFHPPHTTGIASIFVHEFGHHVYFYLKNRQPEAARQLTDSFLKTLRPDAGGRGSIVEQVSQYATTNVHEFVAEAFAESWFAGGQASGLVHEVGGVINKALRPIRKHLPGGHDQQSHGRWASGHSQVPAFETVQEAEDWARERWPDKTIMYVPAPDRPRYFTWDARSANLVNKTLDRLGTEYPTVMADVQYIGSLEEMVGKHPDARYPSGQHTGINTMSLPARAGAPSLLAISDGRARDFDQWAALKKAKDGWTVGDTPESTIVHEFGHHVMYKLRSDRVRELAAGEKTSALDDVVRVLGEMSGNTRNAFSAISGVKIDPDALSKYGSVNFGEFFAEAFTEYKLSANPRPIARSVGQAVDRYFGRVAKHLPTVSKFNPHHEPAGSSRGGQFASAPEDATSSAPTSERLLRAPIESWERTQPWNATKEEIERQDVPGLLYRSKAKGTEDASFESDGRIALSPAYFTRPPETRRAILYHEAGHGLESEYDLAGFRRLGVDDPLDIIDWPGARKLGHNYGEVLAEGYGSMWHDPAWLRQQGADRVVDLVTRMAHERGYPLPVKKRAAVKYLGTFEQVAVAKRVRQFCKYHSGGRGKQRFVDYVVEKHHGPGPHPGTGTPQSAHAGARANDVFYSRHPEGNFDVHYVASEYLASRGMPAMRDHAPQSLTPEEGRAIADWYESADQAPDDPSTQVAYSAFNAEIESQYEWLAAAGYQMIPWDQPGQPYKNSREMRADVRDNRRLYYFRTTEGQPIHNLMTPEQNDRFRAVHDIFGHSQMGNSFSGTGEANAYLDHVQMFSPEARRALTTETLAQNAWFNHSRANEGLRPPERAFADQKALLLDEGLYVGILTRMEESVVKAVKARGREATEDDERPVEGPVDDAEPEDDEDDYGNCPGHRGAREARQAIEKHLPGQHDQSTHGSWATGRAGSIPDSVRAARDAYAQVVSAAQVVSPRGMFEHDLQSGDWGGDPNATWESISQTDRNFYEADAKEAFGEKGKEVAAAFHALEAAEQAAGIVRGPKDEGGNGEPRIVVPAGIMPEGIQVYASEVERTDRAIGRAATVRGSPISPSDPRIPDTVYHVTTSLPEVTKDGMLLAGGVGGLGGDKRDRIISMTIAGDVASYIARDIKTVASLSRKYISTTPSHEWSEAEERWVGDRTEWAKPLIADLQAQARAEGWEWGGSDSSTQLESYGVKDWINHYYMARDWKMTFGVKDEAVRRKYNDPLFFSSAEELAKIDPDRVGVVQIPKQNLDTGALLTDFDLGRNNLEEIRLYGDVPLGESVAKHLPGQHDQKTHGNRGGESQGDDGTGEEEDSPTAEALRRALPDSSLRDAYFMLPDGSTVGGPRFSEVDDHEVILRSVLYGDSYAAEVYNEETGEYDYENMPPFRQSEVFSAMQDGVLRVNSRGGVGVMGLHLTPSQESAIEDAMTMGGVKSIDFDIYSKDGEQVVLSRTIDDWEDLGPFFRRVRAAQRVMKHLPGQHDQSTHGNRAGTVRSTSSKAASVRHLPPEEYRESPAAVLRHFDPSTDSGSEPDSGPGLRKGRIAGQTPRVERFARYLMEKHLPGQHDQSTHGRRGGLSRAPKPGDEDYAEPLPTTLYHGTVAHLSTGDTLRPARLVGHESVYSDNPFYDPYVVYLSTKPHLAGRYAMRLAAKTGAIPRVRPVGLLRRDPEFYESGGLSSDQWISDLADVEHEVPAGEWWDERYGKFHGLTMPVEKHYGPGPHESDSSQDTHGGGGGHRGTGRSGDGWFQNSDGVVRWGRYGAAGILLKHGDRYYLARRGAGTDDPGTWGIPGGALDEFESAREGAVREAREEVGHEGPLKIVREHVYQPADDWSYTTIVAEVDRPFKGKGFNWETDEDGWFTAEEMQGMDLHPGLRAALPQLLSDEPVKKHLPGGHDQMTHGRRVGTHPGVTYAEASGGSYYGDHAYNYGAEARDELAATHKMTTDQYEEAVAAHLAALTAKADVFVRVNADLLDEIANDGRFKSQHEVERSAGGFNRDLRDDLEREVWHYGWQEGEMLEHRPIYGYLSDDPTGESEHDLLDNYGDVRVKLKAGVKDRSSFLLGDSLNESYEESSTEGDPGERVQYDFFPQVSPSPVRKPGVESAWYVNSDDPSFYDPLMLERIQDFDPYAEAQIHGGVKLSDIDTVYIPARRLAWDQVDRSAIEQLKAAGVRIEVVDKEHVQFEDGEDYLAGVAS